MVSFLVDGTQQARDGAAMNKPRALLSIQYLRGLAALAVVGHHTAWTHTDLGQAGVDLFFVISGFIMMHVSGREPSLGAFLWARAVRIVPLYWLATLLAATLGGTTNAGHLLASLLFLPHAGPDGMDWPVLVQGWTLNYEAFFYVAFAASLVLPARFRLPTLTAAFGVLILAGLALHPAGAALSTYTSPMLLEFLAGAWLHWAWSRGWMPTGWQAASCVALGVLLLGVWARVSLVDIAVWRALAYGVPTLLVVTASLGLERCGWLPCVPGLGRVGDSSYALYLTHLFVLQAIHPAMLPLPAVVALPLAIAACVAVGWAVHRWVETPMGSWFRPKTHAPLAAVSLRETG